MKHCDLKEPKTMNHLDNNGHVSCVAVCIVHNSDGIPMCQVWKQVTISCPLNHNELCLMT